jgi:hypothetical protein
MVMSLILSELLEDDQSGEFEENVAPVADELGLMVIKYKVYG